jgi:hypothetical protein
MLSPNLSPSSKRANTSRPAPSGLATNWQKIPRIQSRAAVLPGKHTASLSGPGTDITGTATPDSIDGDSGSINVPHRGSRGSLVQVDHWQPSSRAATSSGEPDAQADVVSYGYGGFVPDDEELETRDSEIKQEKNSASRYKACHISSLINTHTRLMPVFRPVLVYHQDQGDSLHPITHEAPHRK